MKEIISQQLGAILAVGLTTTVIGGMPLLFAYRSRAWWRKRFREPFHEGILRPPGWGCLERRQDALFDLAATVGALPVLGAALAYVAITAEFKTVLGVMLAGVPLAGLGIRAAKRAFERARLARMGFLGECAVAEALDPLMRTGWRVFHDLPMEVDGRKFNIDHVAVGPGGVWAVETKAFSKAKLESRREDELKVAGEEIRLPSGQVKGPLKQARGQALSLRNRLNEEGVNVGYVEPLVMLPGWQVVYKKDAVRNIRDPRNVVSFLNAQEKRLEEAEVEAIAKALEGWCRVLKFEPDEGR